MIFVLIAFAVILLLVVVLLAVHHIQPERLSLGVRSKWGFIGLEVERPSYLKAGAAAPEVPVSGDPAKDP